MSTTTQHLWAMCHRDFESDGGLRDIYIRDVNIKHWRRRYAAINNVYLVEFFIDGERRAFPESVDEVFAIRLEENPLLRIFTGRILAVCHFFVAEEIEMDFDPREIGSESAFVEFLSFLKFLGDAVGKDVSVTYENDADCPFLVYVQGSRNFTYCRE